jgi:hypothetical protein
LKTQLDEHTVATALTKALGRLSSRPLEELRENLKKVANGEIVIAV